MPLPTDEKLLARSEELLDQFAQIFGEHPGFRPAHAKGTMLVGTFVPSATASDLSSAQHFNQDSTAVLQPVRARTVRSPRHHRAGAGAGPRKHRDQGWSA
jgi:catalase